MAKILFVSDAVSHEICDKLVKAGHIVTMIFSFEAIEWFLLKNPDTRLIACEPLVDGQTIEDGWIHRIQGKFPRVIRVGICNDPSRANDLYDAGCDKVFPTLSAAEGISDLCK